MFNNYCWPEWKCETYQTLLKHLPSSWWDPWAFPACISHLLLSLLITCSAPHCHKRPVLSKKHSYVLSLSPSRLLFKSWDLQLTCGCAWSLCSPSCWWPLLGVRWAAPEALCGCSKQFCSYCLFPYAPQRPLGRAGWRFSGSWPGAKSALFWLDKINILSLPFWL